MPNGKNRVTYTYAEITALIVGLVVIVIMAVITTQVRLIPFPFNFMITLGLGIMVFLGVRLVLDRPAELPSIDPEYLRMRDELQAIAHRIADLSRNIPLFGAETAGRLEHIALKLGMLVERYAHEAVDYSGLSKTLLIAQKIDRILSNYAEIKSGRLFMEPREREEVIARIQTWFIPRIESAFESLGRQIDADKASDVKISMQVVDSILKGLALLEDLDGQLDADTANGRPALTDGSEKIDPFGSSPNTDHQSVPERKDMQ